MVKLLTGSFVAAIAMFITGFIFYATPLHLFAYGSTGDLQQATIQSALAANLPETGTYMIPATQSAEGTVMYGKGPVAIIHYNSGGFSVADPGVLLGGFVHEFVVALILAAALAGIAGRVTDFETRAKTAVLFAVAGSLLMHLGEPIWYHHDWPHFIYLFIADTVMLSVAGVILARWFMPREAATAV